MLYNAITDKIGWQMATIKVEILAANLGTGLQPGQIVRLRTDERGQLVSRFWRRRLIDSKSDNCMRVLQPVKSKPVKNVFKRTILNDDHDTPAAS